MAAPPATTATFALASGTVVYHDTAAVYGIAQVRR